jgi:hypothetical protein
MQEMTAHSWKRRGCSLVWSPDLLRDLITGIEATPLDLVVEWQRSGFPEDTPAGANTVLVGGLQTVLNVMPDAEASYAWLRTNILPLCRKWTNHWPRVGLVFGMDGPGRRFDLNEADDLVYFGREPERNNKVCLTRAIWNGAATGTGVFKLMQEGSREIGGFHVVKVS